MIVCVFSFSKFDSMVSWLISCFNSLICLQQDSGVPTEGAGVVASGGGHGEQHGSV